MNQAFKKPQDAPINPSLKRPKIFAETGAITQPISEPFSFFFSDFVKFSHLKSSEKGLRLAQLNGKDMMDGWPAMETDAGRAEMKTPATKAKDLFKVLLPTPVATTISISRGVDNLLCGSACPGRSLPVLY